MCLKILDRSTVYVPKCGRKMFCMNCFVINSILFVFRFFYVLSDARVPALQQCTIAQEFFGNLIMGGDQSKEYRKLVTLCIRFFSSANLNKFINFNFIFIHARAYLCSRIALPFDILKRKNTNKFVCVCTPFVIYMYYSFFLYSPI